MLKTVLRAALLALTLSAVAEVPAIRAGVVNPDISLIGQPAIRWSDDASDPARKRPTMALGETELVFDAALNPYARGTAVFSLSEEGIEVEEAFFTMLRGLPAGLALKGGKYRAGFGKLNMVHPHANPFAERFRVLAAYLPGDESLNETGLQVSTRIPMPGDLSLTASADWLQGDSFRLERVTSGATNDPLESTAEGDRIEEPRPASLGRLSGFVPIGDLSGIELGFSALRGTNNVAAAARTRVLGGDVKAKLWNTARSYLVVQGEFLQLDLDEAGWDSVGPAYRNSPLKRAGGYVFADYNFATRYDVGASLESFQSATAGKIRDQAVGLFAGLALLEESTVFRLAWERFMPGTPAGATTRPEAIQSLTLRVIYSMGPHKVHQF